MRVLGKFIYSLFIALIIISCKDDKEIDDSEIRERYFQLEKVGWKSKTRTQKIDDIGFTATEVPVQYYLLKDLGNEDLFNVDSIYQENKKERIVEFIFEQEEGKDLLDEKFTGITYEEGLKYLSFSIAKDFYVVTSKKDTISCAGVNYERSYKIAPYQKVLLFFSGIEPEDKIQLIYNDNLFKKGTVKFRFKDKYTEIKL